MNRRNSQQQGGPVDLDSLPRDPPASLKRRGAGMKLVCGGCLGLLTLLPQ
jgi:hypothetical protein